MFQAWRLQLKQAAEALKGDRLDEAQQVLCEGRLREYLPGRELSVKVADRMAQRAQRKAFAGDTSAGWRDLETACSLGGETGGVLNARTKMISEALVEVENYLEAGDAHAALAQLDKLHRRNVTGGRVRTLRQVTLRVHQADRLRSRGKFSEADAELAAAEALRPDLKPITRQRQQCRQGAAEARKLTQALHRAMTAGRWSRAVSLADKLLELAPACRLARDARRRAWAEVGTLVADSRRLAETQHWVSRRRRVAARTTPSSQRSAEVDNVAKVKRPARALLWVDAVGGFLVCLADEIMLGQAVPHAGIDVPIQADLSRRHAKIRRMKEGYVIDPLGPVWVEGRAIEDTTLLHDGDEIQLGPSVRVRFRRPHALSATARLDVVSRHRTEPPCDAVLLMAESFVLGPQGHNHVVCRDWSDDLVLYRQGDQVHCRAGKPIEIDGQPCDGQGSLVSLRSRITGNDFAISLEEA